jgi:hypothetical protein
VNSAVEDELLEANPVSIRGAGVTRRKHGIEPATLDEPAIIVAAMPERPRLMVLLATWCALRYGELARLRRRDIDLTNGVPKVRRAVTFTPGTPAVGPPKTDAGVRDVARLSRCGRARRCPRVAPALTSSPAPTGPQTHSRPT